MRTPHWPCPSPVMEIISRIFWVLLALEFRSWRVTHIPDWKPLIYVQLREKAIGRGNVKMASKGMRSRNSELLFELALDSAFGVRCWTLLTLSDSVFKQWSLCGEHHWYFTQNHDDNPSLFPDHIQLQATFTLPIHYWATVSNECREYAWFLHLLSNTIQGLTGQDARFTIYEYIAYKSRWIFYQHQIFELVATCVYDNE